MKLFFPSNLFKNRVSRVKYLIPIFLRRALYTPLRLVRSLVVLSLLLLLSINLIGQGQAPGSIAVSRDSSNVDMSVDELFRDIFVADCIKLDNVKFGFKYFDLRDYSWHSEDHVWDTEDLEDRQLGHFTKSDSDFPLSEGLVISTGRARSAEGPNLTPSSSDQIDFHYLVNYEYIDGTTGGGVDDFEYEYGSSSPYLETISGGDTYNAATLEFDFTATGDSIQFRYIFASEEYREYITSAGSFNDAFAFLLTEYRDDGSLDESTTVNIAVLDDGSPITVKNINGGFSQEDSIMFANCGYPDMHIVESTNEQFYIDNGSGLDGDTNNSRTTSFDGMTTPLVAKSRLKPCVKYNLRLTIANVGDNLKDAALFLEAKSFKSNISFKSYLPSDTTVYCPDDVPTLENLEASNPCVVTVAPALEVREDICGTSSYTLERSWKAYIEGCTDTIRHSHTISVIDTAAPVITNNDLRLYLDKFGEYMVTEIDSAQIVFDITDACSNDPIIVTVSPIPDKVSCDDVAAGLDIEISAEDVCGNISREVSHIEVVDTIKPIIECIPEVLDTIVIAGEGSMNLVVPTPNVEESCSYTLLNSYNGSDDASDTYPVGETTVWWVAEDSSNNVDSCQMVITVLSPPVAYDKQFIIYDYDLDCITFSITDDNGIDENGRLCDSCIDYDMDSYNIGGILYDQIEIVSDPTNGTLVSLGDDIYQYCLPDRDGNIIDEFTYLIRDADGLTATATVHVFYYNELKIPEAFSPNNDNINDTFEIIGLNPDDVVKCSVFNRWNRLIYRSDDYINEGWWDGRAMFGVNKGSIVPSGPYLYMIGVEGDPIKYKGVLYLAK